MIAQLGCDHGLHQHVHYRLQSAVVPVPVAGGVLVDTAIYKYYIPSQAHLMSHGMPCIGVMLASQTVTGAPVCGRILPLRVQA